MRQEYFERYLSNIRGLKDSTVRHYEEALRKINSVLHQLGFDEFESLYDVDSYEQLKELKSALLLNQDFKDLDERGNRMYTAGLNRYMEFAEAKHFLEKPKALSLVDCPSPVLQKQVMSERFIPNRDRIIVRQVLSSEHFLCESNPGHVTFISEKYRTPFMEGHHLIPLNNQGYFGYSLDVYANITCLCPTCHRMLHLGLKEDKVKVWKHLFDHHQDRLENSGITLGKKEFLEMVM